MKTKFLLFAFMGCLLLTSCERETTQTELESFETTFQKKGLSDPFAFNYTIITTEGESVQLTSQQVKEFISGELMGSDEIIEFTDYSLEMNPNDEMEYAIKAISIDGKLKIAVHLVKNEVGFELSGKKCKCEANCNYGCDAEIWGGKCQCDPCSDRQKCKKTSEIEVPDTSIIAAP